VPPLTPRLVDQRRRFGVRVRQVREQRGLTQERLGELAGVDRKTVNRIETGVHSILLDRLFALADALKIPPAELFLWDDAPPA
jgi:putative transcriptional regulator